MDFNDVNRTRSWTVFANDFRGIITENGFSAAYDLDPVVSTNDLPRTEVSMEREFESLGSSNIPSDAGQEIWRVRKSRYLCLFYQLC